MSHTPEWQEFCETARTYRSVTKADLFKEMWKVFTSEERDLPTEPLRFGKAKSK